MLGQGPVTAEPGAVSGVARLTLPMPERPDVEQDRADQDDRESGVDDEVGHMTRQ
jgi:hypothetical protein